MTDRNLGKTLLDEDTLKVVSAGRYRKTLLAIPRSQLHLAPSEQLSEFNDFPVAEKEKEDGADEAVEDSSPNQPLPLNSTSLLVFIAIVVGVVALGFEGHGYSFDLTWNDVVLGYKHFPSSVPCGYFANKGFRLHDPEGETLDLRNQSPQDGSSSESPGSLSHLKPLAHHPSIREGLLRRSFIDPFYLTTMVIFILFLLTFLLIYGSSARLRVRNKMVGLFLFFGGSFCFFLAILLHVLLSSAYSNQHSEAVEKLLAYESEFYEVRAAEGIIVPKLPSVSLAVAVKLHEQLTTLRQILRACDNFWTFSTFLSSETPEARGGVGIEGSPASLAESENKSHPYVDIRGNRCHVEELEEIGFCQHVNSKFVAWALTVIVALCCWAASLMICLYKGGPELGISFDTPATNTTQTGKEDESVKLISVRKSRKSLSQKVQGLVDMAEADIAEAGSFKKNNLRSLRRKTEDGEKAQGSFFDTPPQSREGEEEVYLQVAYTKYP